MAETSLYIASFGLIIIIVIIASTVWFENKTLVLTAAVFGFIYSFMIITHALLSDEKRENKYYTHLVLRVLEIGLIIVTWAFVGYALYGELIKPYPIREFRKMSLVAGGIIGMILVYTILLIRLYKSGY